MKTAMKLCPFCGCRVQRNLRSIPTIVLVIALSAFVCGYVIAFYRSIPQSAQGVLWLSHPVCGCGIELHPCESCRELRSMTDHRRKSVAAVPTGSEEF
jgi:hypothetical protein